MEVEVKKKVEEDVKKKVEEVKKVKSYILKIFKGDFFFKVGDEF